MKENFGIKSHEDITIKQYIDENVKNKEGENRKEVTKRMLDGFYDVANKNKGKEIAIFTHAAAIKFLLMYWCKLENIKEDKHITLSFNNKVIVDKILDAPETFKITIDESNKIKDIEYIEFSDLK